VVECDDWIELNKDSPFKVEHKRYDAYRTITRTMEVADMVTTTTKYLANKLKKYNNNVVVLPNYIDIDEWNLPLIYNDTGTIRIGWVGSITHVDDVKMIVEPIKSICKEFKNVQLVTMGDPRVGALFKGLPVESQNGVPYDAYPAKLRSLRLDIGLAPLQDNVFNRCKSNIKWLEYSLVGVPGVYSPIVYTDEVNHSVHFDGIYGQVAENEEQWYRCIKNYIICENLRKDIASRARGCVISGYTLKTNIKRWVKAYKSLTKIKKEV
jgi:glycosyltransferase involved in cell wall biosynthesis